MDSINTLRAILVAGAVIAGIGAFIVGEIMAGIVMMIAVAAHGWMWWFLYRLRHPVHAADDARPRPVR